MEPGCTTRLWRTSRMNCGWAQLVSDTLRHQRAESPNLFAKVLPPWLHRSGAHEQVIARALALFALMHVCMCASCGLVPLGVSVSVCARLRVALLTPGIRASGRPWDQAAAGWAQEPGSWAVGCHLIQRCSTILRHTYQNQMVCQQQHQAPAMDVECRAWSFGWCRPLQVAGRWHAGRVYPLCALFAVGWLDAGICACALRPVNVHASAGNEIGP